MQLHLADACDQSHCSAQLEFVQILVIVVVMMMMITVISCLLNHYRLSARSLISSRHGPAHRRHLPSEASLWSSEAPGSSAAISEVYTPRPPDRVPSYLQRERLDRFQPTYPPRPHHARFQPTYPPRPHHARIELPPTIALADGEEPPPYQGPCALQLRDPEQQLELNRESVRAPPNRTVFDRRPAPPAYSEVIGHYCHPQAVLQLSQSDSRNAHSKDQQKVQLV